MTDFRTLLTRAYPDAPSERQRILALAQEIETDERTIRRWIYGEIEPPKVVRLYLEGKRG